MIPHIRLQLGTLLTLFAFAAGPALADFQQDVMAAYEVVLPLMEDLEQRVLEGDVAGANSTLLEAFPETTRTPAQAFLLGNLLYGLAPEISFELHRSAAARLPDEPSVQLEWAMEQHRAGQHEGAAAAYAVFLKSYPDHAPAHGLAADCLLRLGRTADALTSWQLSERARTGTIEDFESLVCAVYFDATGELRRADLIARLRAGDEQAAVALIAMDCDFRKDWWNSGPRASHLAFDLDVIRKQDLPVTPELSAAICAAECGIAMGERNLGKIPESLKRHGLLVDADQTLPGDGAILSILLHAATRAGVLKEREARVQLAPKVLEMARAGADPALWNVAAFLHIGSEKMEAVDREAWHATGEARFAAGCLVERHKSGVLPADDPELLRAVEQFPEDSVIAMLYVEAHEQADLPLKAPLIQAIKAEYRHFSPGGFLPRPKAARLREYFQKLAAEAEE